MRYSATILKEKNGSLKEKKRIIVKFGGLAVGVEVMSLFIVSVFGTEVIVPASTRTESVGATRRRKIAKHLRTPSWRSCFLGSREHPSPLPKLTRAQIVDAPRNVSR